MSSFLIAISLGEPAGLGPDILIKAAQQPRTTPWVVFGSAQVLQERARALALSLHLSPYGADQAPSVAAGCLTIVDMPCVASVEAGCLNALNSAAVLAVLTAAANFCEQGSGRALLTLPIHKGIINAAGTHFTGHTEYLAALSNVAKVVMMLGSATLKVALQTVHIPLKTVTDYISRAEITQTLAIIQTHWQRFYGYSPRILVLGVNPHAGEGGYLGSEERDIIEPTLQALQQQGYDLVGPVAADTAFTTRALQGVDVVLAMYHDQGLAPLKALAFGEVVNYTLGLPYIRTSVDHGVALDVAGTGIADIGSFLAALAATEAMLAACA